MSRRDRRASRTTKVVIEKKPIITYIVVWLFVAILVLSLLALMFTSTTVATN